jgi:shikimate dehydrogenase
VNLKHFKQSSLSSSPHFLLIGNPVAHSLSPVMHNSAAAYYDIPVRYYAIQVDETELPSFAAYLREEQLKGVNVTIPHKQAMLPYMDRTEAECGQIGALNTIVKERGVKEEGELIGYNTDVHGFCAPLQAYQPEIEGARGVVFGTGGAARGVAFGLLQLGIEEILLVSRDPRGRMRENWPHRVQISPYDAWPSYAEESSVFVNATPLGMAPHTEGSPVRPAETELLTGKICYDIVYHPLQTTFLKQAEEAGARAIGGLEMLIHQGSRSFELWTGRAFPIEHVREQIIEHLTHAD